MRLDLMSGDLMRLDLMRLDLVTLDLVTLDLFWYLLFNPGLMRDRLARCRRLGDRPGRRGFILRSSRLRLRRGRLGCSEDFRHRNLFRRDRGLQPGRLGRSRRRGILRELGRFLRG